MQSVQVDAAELTERVERSARSHIEDVVLVHSVLDVARLTCRRVVEHQAALPRRCCLDETDER
eukprot:scaffold14334_cov28-Tisochrysis_lutea.AAC.7